MILQADLTWIILAAGAAFFLWMIFAGARRPAVQAVIYFADGRVALARRTAVIHSNLELYVTQSEAVLALVRYPPVVVRSFPSILALRILYAEHQSPRVATATDMDYVEARTMALLELTCRGSAAGGGEAVALADAQQCIRELLDKVTRKLAERQGLGVITEDVAVAVELKADRVAALLSSFLAHHSLVFRDAIRVASNIFEDYRTMASIIKSLSRQGNVLRYLIWIIIALVLMAVLLPVAQNIFGGLLPQPR
mgnify:CR=1 FL=1